MRSPRRILLLGALLPLGLFSSVQEVEAAAAPIVVSLDGTTVVVTGTTGDDVMDIDLRSAKGTVTQHDSPVPISAGPGCATVSNDQVECLATITTLRVTTGRGDDVIGVIEVRPGGVTLTNPIYVDAGPDDDEVTTLGYELYGDVLGGAGADHIELVSNQNPRADGGSGNDELLAFGQAVLEGGSGNDHLGGSLAADVLFGDSGNDVIEGNGGNDLLLGDHGKDQLDGGAGADVAYGGYGNDTIRGGAEPGSFSGAGDELVGNSGKDVIESGARPGTLLRGGEGNDSVNANNGVADRMIDCGEGSQDGVLTDPGEIAYGCEKTLS
ncbi:calcium-binding protein [Nocardioides humilatus]|uniref:Calcium-binding protein n=1 Tax=Nocardioides humilatus TaxID=2607660 RepID=A0A5B1L4I1_9ACTN|nr:calcium-binding protein [Nocardioides humilatus]KAA1415346.1 calcium-binding protein [Nocardioides humilatus]